MSKEKSDGLIEFIVVSILFILGVITQIFYANLLIGLIFSQPPPKDFGQWVLSWFFLTLLTGGFYALICEYIFLVTIGKSVAKTIDQVTKHTDGLPETHVASELKNFMKECLEVFLDSDRDSRPSSYSSSSSSSSSGRDYVPPIMMEETIKCDWCKREILKKNKVSGDIEKFLSPSLFPVPYDFCSRKCLEEARHNSGYYK